MTNGRKLSMASFTAIAVALAGCGGGGGVDSMPPAPVAATPTSSTFAISAPQRASTASGAIPILASPSGPTFAAGTPTSTVFPLLQTAMVYGSSGATADLVANSAGGNATYQQGALNLNVAAFQAVDPGYRYSSSGYDNLDWTRAGYWVTGGNKWDYDDAVGRNGVFVTGYQTPQAGMPTVGTASYSGLVQGTVFHVGQPDDYQGGTGGSTHCACDAVALSGNAFFTANFGTRGVSGSLTGMTAGGAAWNDVAFVSTIAGNAFSGTTSVTTAPSGWDSLAIGATGTIEGRFFGPTAQEAGAVWTLFDGTNAAMGTLTGKHP